jgi:hypothetical protein
MIATFDIEAARRSAETYRAARLALLNMRAMTSIEQTDAAARTVEEALAHFAEDIGVR